MVSLVFIVASSIGAMAILGIILNKSLKKIYGELQKRRTEDGRLTRKQKKIMRRARRLYESNQVSEASAMLESMSLNRAAVEMCERSGDLDGAAKILVRLGKVSRAGALFARYGFWDKALKFYELAGNHIEEARCLRELGRYSEAAQIFENSGAFSEAMDSYKLADNYLGAARMAVNCRKYEFASSCYQKVLNQKIDWSTFDLSFMIDSSVRADAGRVYWPVILQMARGEDLLLSLLYFARIPDAADLYSKFTPPTLQTLIARTAANEDQQKSLAKMFRAKSMHKEAAQVYENMHDFARAGQEYTLAKLPSEAKRCERLFLEVSPQFMREGDFFDAKTKIENFGTAEKKAS